MKKIEKLNVRDDGGLKGDVIIERRNANTGEVIDREELHNLVVTTGKERVAKLIGGVSSDVFDSMACGTGTTSPVAGDIALETEVKEQACDGGSPAYEAINKITFEATFEFGSGESYNITEAGVFDAIGSGKVMLDRFTFSAKAVDADTNLYVKVTVTVS